MSESSGSSESQESPSATADSMTITTASRVSEKPAVKGRILWHNLLFMTLTPLAAAVFTPLYLWQHGSSWGLWIFFLICFSINNLTITTGYHRLFAHRSFEAHPLVRWLIIFIGSGAFQGSALQWSTDHRRHHREIDSDADPYTIKKGFWYAHLFWMFREDLHPEAKNWAKDLEKNRWIALQHRYYPWIATLVGFFLPGLIGWALGFGFWGGLVIGGLLRIVLTQHSTFLINSLAHTLGKQTYTDKHTARDSVLCAFLTFGEGYHNFHHTFQADYRNGMRWYQWDPTKWTIKALSYVRLASRLKQAQKEEILKARLAMEARFMLAKGASAERVSQLKMQIEEAQKKVKLLRDAYRAATRDLAERGRIWRLQKRAEIRMAEIEFRSAYGQWRTFRRVIKRTAIAA